MIKGWNQWEMFYKILKPGASVTGERLRFSFKSFGRNKKPEKRLYIGQGRWYIRVSDITARQHKGTHKFRGLPNQNDLQWDILPHPANVPGITLSDFNFFSSYKAAISDWRWVVKNMDEFITSKQKYFFLHRIHQLPDQWQRVQEADRCWLVEWGLYFIWFLLIQKNMPNTCRTFLYT